jgi:hypothetical protein
MANENSIGVVNFGHMILKLILGGTRADDLISDVTEKLVRMYQRISGIS